MKIYNYFLILIVLAVLLPNLVLGHTHLLKSKPAANEEVKSSPKAILLEFSEEIEPRFSKIEVVREDGEKSIEIGDLTPVENSKNHLQVTFKNSLLPGKYKVKWKATSIDTHKSHGEFSFTYNQK